MWVEQYETELVISIARWQTEENFIVTRNNSVVGNIEIRFKVLNEK